VTAYRDGKTRDMRRKSHTAAVAALCVTDSWRTAEAAAKAALTDFGLQPYGHT